MRSRSIRPSSASGAQHHPDQPYSDPRVTVDQRRRASFPADDDEEVRPRRVRADRFADDAVELLGRAARELHVHRGVVPRRARPADAGRRCSSSTTTSASAGWSIGWRIPPRRRSAQEPRVHVHEARAFLGVLMAGPRLAPLTAPPRSSRTRSRRSINRTRRARRACIERDPSIEPATDDWPFLYLRDRAHPAALRRRAGC